MSEKRSVSEELRALAEHLGNVGLTDTPIALDALAARVEAIAGEMRGMASCDVWKEPKRGAALWAAELAPEKE